MDAHTRTGPARTDSKMEDAWEQVAPNYARYVDPVSVLAIRPALRLAKVGPSTTVLDVACGAGALALQAARDAARVLAVDLSPTFVQIITERARHAGLRNVTAEVMDGQDLAIGDEAFDRAYSMFGLMMFPDRARGFRELHRVLADGGQAVVSSFGPGAQNPFGLLQQSVAKTMPELVGPPPPGIELSDPQILKQEMEQGGFRDVRVETVTHDLGWTDPEDYWQAVTQSNPIFAPAMAQMAAAPRARLHEEVMQRLAALTDDAGVVHHEVAVHYGVGTKEVA